MQNKELEAIWIWIYHGNFLLGMNPIVALLADRGEPPGTMRSKDGSMERADAQIWRGSANVLQAHLLYVGQMIANRCGGR